MEPQKTSDYPRLGRVYRIWNDVDDKEYVGSTFQSLCERMRDHRGEINTKHKAHRLIYTHMRDLGTEHFRIELVEECMVNSREELLRLEGHYIRKFGAKLNKVIAGRTHDEYRVENRDKKRDTDKRYYQANKVTMSEKNKEYRTQHADNIREQKREYRKVNHDQIVQKKKEYWYANVDRLRESKRITYARNPSPKRRADRQYYLDNKEKHNAYGKAYYETHKDDIRQTMSQPMICICGAVLSRKHHGRHLTSSIHKSFMRFGGLDDINI